MMKKLMLGIAVGLFVTGAARAEDTPPPIPVVAQDAKALAGAPRAQSDNVAARTEQFNAMAKAGGFDVLFLGDSITHSWESAHGKDVWEKRIAPLNAVNFGLGGDTTDTLIWRLDHGNLEGALDPKVVVLMIGTNNGFRDKPEETAAGIGAIVTRIHERLPKAKILLYAIFPRIHPGGEVAQKSIQEVNRIIAKYDGHWNIKYIDIGAQLTKPDGSFIDGVTWDGLHLTKKGYEIWADSLVPAIEAIVGKAQSHLWDREPPLLDEARKFRIVRPLSAVFGWEGPRATVFEPRTGKGGVNISNERLESWLWGTPDRLTLSIGKSDVFDRAHLTHEQGKKPVGQLLLLAEDFAGAAQPPVSTSIHDGENAFRLEKGPGTADIRILLTDKETNIIAIRASYSNLAKSPAVRLYRHCDTRNAMPPPRAGSEGGYFWIRQEFAADKTFPQGFDYYLVAKIAGETNAADVAEGKAGLGANVLFRDAAAPGAAATVRLSAESKREVVVYATVVTRAESADPLTEARKRLAAAEARGYAALLAEKEAWCRDLYARRERGRIFTGNIDDARNVILPFFYQGSFQSRHTYGSNPDPTRYEGDAGYNILEDDRVAWCGLQCFNEELYTGDFVAGRDETCAPYYVKLYNLWRPVFEAYARERGLDGLLVLRGYVPPIKSDVYWSPDAPANSRQACDWATMVWSFKNVWDAFDYGGLDLAFLRDSVYPSLRGIADFFASKAVPGEDGYCHIEPSQIREEDGGRDAIDCIAAAKWAFRTAILASQMLDADADRREKWRGRLDTMAPYYAIKDGNGEPIFASLVQNGTPVVAGHGTSHFVVNVADEINLDSTEEQKQMAIRANRRHYTEPMNRQVEFLLGKRPDTLCMTSCMASPAWLIHYAQQSGTGDYSTELELKTQAQKTIACWLEPERLCNSRSGTIHLFPCVPSNFDVAFKDFQARGGFLVTGELRAGRVAHVGIKARRHGDCAVMNPWPGSPLHVYEVPGHGRVATVRSGEKYTFPAVAGKEYALVKEAEIVGLP